MNYTCVNDLQGADFALGRTLTIEGWRQQGISWATMDDYDGICKALSKMPSDKVIDYIEEFWGIEIKPTNTISEERLKEFTYFGYKAPNKNDLKNTKRIIEFLKEYC